MKKEFKNFFSSHKISFFLFFFFLIYNFFVVNNLSFCKIDEITYTFHIVDFSVGFCTKLLPGAIYNLLFPSTTASLINIYINVIYHIFLFVVCFLLEKFVLHSQQENKIFAFILAMFFVSGPSTFAIHAKEFGMLDTYWVFFLLLSIIFLQNKVMKWFIPILCFLSVMTHLASLTTFIPFFLLIILFDATQNQKIEKSKIVIFILCFILSFSAGFYFAAFESDNLLLNVTEFNSLLDSRNQSDWETYTTYYDYSLFKLDSIGSNENFSTTSSASGSSFSLFLSTVLNQIRYIMGIDNITSELILMLLRCIFVTLPLLFFIYKHLIKIRKTCKVNPHVITLALLFFPCSFFASILFSPDLVRWFGHCFLMLFTFFLFAVYKTNYNIKENLNKTGNTPIYKITIYFVLYALYIVHPYY